MSNQYDRCIDLAGKIARAERDLLASVVCDPSRGVLVAESEGITPDRFDEPDLRIIFLSAMYGQQNGRDVVGVLNMARAGLRDASYWDDTQIAKNVGSMLWSDASLARLASEAFPHDAEEIRRRARWLIDVSDRSREASDLYARLESILDGTAEPAPLVVRSKVMFVLAPMAETRGAA